MELIIKSSSIASLDKLKLSIYPAGGVYLNTDENGIKEYIFVSNIDTIAWLLPYESFKHILGEVTKESVIKENIKEEVVESKESMVTEDFALKMMALVVNKEKLKDIK